MESIGKIVDISSIYETSPVGMKPGTGTFLNLALALETNIQPHDMLLRIKRFEKEMGRENRGGSDRSRTIDIDILLSGHLIVSEKDLIIPHPRMTERAFVLVPLNEIAPEVIHPVLKKKMINILKELHSSENVDKYRKKS